MKIRCAKCLLEKLKTEFYDGDRWVCKKCTNQRSRRNYRKNIEREKKRNRENYLKKRELYIEKAKEYRATKKGRLVARKANSKWKKAHPEAIRAHNIVRRAGLKHGTCQAWGCKKPGVDWHHDDYSKPLDVKDFCRKHHMAHGKNLDNQSNPTINEE